jgi:hypothetical protein
MGEVAHETALSEQARTPSRRKGDGDEARVGRAAYPVILCQRLVEVADRAREQSGEKAVTLAQRLVHEARRLLDEEPAEIGCEGSRLGEVRQAFELAPLNVKVAEDGRAAIIEQHARRLGTHVGGRVQSPLPSGLHQLGVRNIAPQEERESRGGFLGSQRDDRLAAGARRTELEPIQEVR